LIINFKTIKKEQEMKKKKVIIIGAGIAGLSAASYLQRSGYQAEIFEAHSLPGGVCTSWKRGDYTFDYCVHWLLGTKKGTGPHFLYYLGWLFSMSKLPVIL
jgi:phytoene dehydrogenase-like protein